MLPAYNEEQLIEKAIRCCEEAAEKITADYEILVVNDKGEDRTEEVIKRVTLSKPRIKGIFLSRKMGYGNALATGFYNATKDFVFYTDSDMPIDISKELPCAVSLVSDDVDAVIGYRINRQDRMLRRFYSAVYNFMTRFILGIKVRDVNFSCKLLRREVFKNFKLYSHSGFIDAELLANLIYRGFKIKEFPATYLSRKDGNSSFDSLFGAVAIFMELLIFKLFHFVSFPKRRGR